MLEENVAYALASWKHFEDSITNDLLRAVTGGFALVAAADGEMAASEVDRFMKLLHDHADRFIGLDFIEVERVFRDICSAILSDPSTGRQHALDCIALVALNTKHAELVRSAAEIALAADKRDLTAEHPALDAICMTLALSPRKAETLKD